MSSETKGSYSPGIRRLALLWAGTVIGCTFIATPAKFQVPSLSLPIALEVGRSTFRAIGVVELVFALIWVALLLRGRSLKPQLIAVPVILAIEWFIVMPPLDDRTLAEIQGRPVGAGNLHVAFMLLELLKLGLLLWIGFASWSSRAPEGCLTRLERMMEVERVRRVDVAVPEA